MRRRYKKAHWYYRGGIASPPSRVRRRWRLTQAEIRQFGQTVVTHRRRSFMALALMVGGGTLILFGVEASGPQSTQSAVRADQAVAATSTTGALSTSPISFSEGSVPGPSASTTPPPGSKPVSLPDTTRPTSNSSGGKASVGTTAKAKSTAANATASKSSSGPTSAKPTSTTSPSRPPPNTTTTVAPPPPTTTTTTTDPPTTTTTTDPTTTTTTTSVTLPTLPFGL